MHMKIFKQKNLPKNSLKKSLKRITLIGIIFGIICIIGAVLLLLRKPAAVNDSEGYDYYAQMMRAEVSSYFSATYQVNLGSDETAWEKEYGGESPIEMLNEKVNEAMKYDKALQTLAEQYDVEPVMPLGNALLQQWEEFNRQRAELIAEGEIVYGPEQYELLAYYLECRGNAETALVEYFLKDAIANHEDLLYERYEAADTSELTRDRTATLHAYIIGSEEFTAQPDAAYAALEIIRNRLIEDSDCTLEELSASCGFPLEEKELVLDSTLFSREDTFSPALLSLADESTCFIGPLDSTYTSFCVYQVTEYSYERPSFEESLMTIAAVYANETLDAEIARLTNE